jgi:MscS family membrane protein
MLWKWLSLFFCVFLAALFSYMIFRILRAFSKRLSAPKNRWPMILIPITIMIIIVGAEEFIRYSIRVTGEVMNSITVVSTVFIVVMVIWAVFSLCRAIAETIIALPRMREKSLDASLLRIGSRFLAFVIGVWIVIVSLRHLGADLIPLLAGLGVGGLAVALAAQRTLANFIGSLILYATKPVKPGDFCRYGDQIGTVEQIGLLSTQIRSLERTIITVPNAEFSEMKLDNFTMRDQRLLKTTLQLRYETTSEQMRYILAKLRELLLRHPKVAEVPLRVRFVDYGAYSKDVEIFAYLRCQDQETFLAIKEDILLRVEDIINEAGSGFAFPSQTAYLSRDTGVDTERQSGVEAQVENWRLNGKLPFPEFDDSERRQIKNTLDYPPKGSPDYRPPIGKGE